ncbi:transposable element Tcb1 transposase [Trichonephila clavipes]|nr:transposable element Tcb1 transposase [Trichonephila clavipes]
MSEYKVNAIKTPAACLKTVFEDRVQLCGHNKNISFLNEDGVSRQGKVMHQHPKKRRFLKTRIIGQLECGRTQLEVSEELGIAHSVVSRFWPRFQENVTAKRNRRSTASDLSLQLSSATGTTVSRQTVYRRLGHIGLYARRPVRCVPLTATHCRLQFI